MLLIRFPGVALSSARCRILGALVLSCCALAFLPSGANASMVNCSGKATGDKHDKTLLNYTFRCTEEIKSYSGVATQDVSAFAPEVDVTDAAGSVQSKESFSCEGVLPSA